MRLLLSLALVALACAPASSEPVVEPVRSTLTGTADNAKGGAVLVCDDGRVVYVAGLDSWPDELLEKRMTAAGVLARRKHIPDPVVAEDGAISQGAVGDQWVLDEAEWKESEIPPGDAVEPVAPVATPTPVLHPGENRLDLHPGPGTLEIEYSGWLPCDGQFVLKTKRKGRKIEVRATDVNPSAQRVSCVGPTELGTVLRDLPPGTYEVAFHPGRGHRVLTGKATIEK